MGVMKKANLVPLKAKADQYSFFLMGQDSDPPSYLVGAYLELVEWPRTLVVAELMGNALVLADLPDGSTLELVRIPGNRAAGNYSAGTPMMEFESCIVMRKLVRPDTDGLELVLVVDCIVTIL
jgi:hypothetical protein